MSNLILRMIGCVGLSFTLGGAIGASSLEQAFMGGFMYLLFSSIEPSK